LEEAEKFLEDGVFSSDLGDTMVLALSNALFTILSSICGHPIINVLPRHTVASFPLLIAYNQWGADAVAMVNLSDQQEKVLSTLQQQQQNDCETTTFCTCGKNDKAGKEHCHPTTKKYTSVCYCPCFKANSRCSSHCKCKRCNNPLGKNILTEDASPNTAHEV
jgi:hypothetical protein